MLEAHLLYEVVNVGAFKVFEKASHQEKDWSGEGEDDCEEDVDPDLFSTTSKAGQKEKDVEKTLAEGPIKEVEPHARLL